MQLSVVTVCYNDAPALLQTLKSVAEQSDQDFEYLVIDGASTDNTSEIVPEYKAVISSFISEPDRGIYDAMNKGIALSQGEYVIFLNAGDIFASPKTIKYIRENLSSNDSVVLFPCVNKSGRLLKSYRGSFKKLKWESFGCHQGYVIKSTLYGGYGFNTDYRIKADRDLLLSLYLAGSKFRYVQGEAVCIYDTAGVSHQAIVRKEIENIRISMRHKGAARFKTLVYSGMKMFLYKVSQWLSIDWEGAKAKLMRNES